MRIVSGVACIKEQGFKEIRRLRAHIEADSHDLALTYISGNSLGNLTPRSTFSVWKFPWKYDLLWRQKLQETGISNTAVSRLLPGNESWIPGWVMAKSQVRS